MVSIITGKLWFLSAALGRLLLSSNVRYGSFPVIGSQLWRRSAFFSKRSILRCANLSFTTLVFHNYRSR